MRSLFIVLFCAGYVTCRLWRKGVVHYAINKKDYDIHSQDEIITTLSQLQNEICVKFFYTPNNYTADERDKILFINNPDKRKNCPPSIYNFTGSVIDMPIGYKCINRKDIARIVMEMLRASVEQTVSTINSYDLVKKFQERDADPTHPTLLSPPDRNYINAHYHVECGAQAQRSVASRRLGDTSDPLQLTADNMVYYKDKIWPLGIVMYGVDEKLRTKSDYSLLKYAMTTIELGSCVVFQEIDTNDGVLTPKNYLWYSNDGEDVPLLGFREGKQSINLETMVHGAPGHAAHVLVNLMRALGVPMMSNRFDRDNYVTIDWKKIQKGKEHHFERAPVSAWIATPYDFESVTHAPANYMCGDCDLGGQSVKPLQDHLWQRTLSMGHANQMSNSDSKLLDLLYRDQCRERMVSDNFEVMKKTADS
ncbi:Zinc metalloproteinase nas-14 [Papilio xuthus]|uniref:Metalloendopeptidase n=1 Tax=Papilio xuthus TaxID=66420 RepID=A0A0N1IA80_PAPXU|nr:Zinc metalloproteinase nas-14 [Papilio xuthus]